MHAYRVYGLGLHSEAAFPELLPCADAPADIVIARGELPISARDDADDSWAERHPERNETLCVFEGVGRFLVQHGRRIVVDPAPEVHEAIVRHLLLGPVLAHLLWQRDVFTLHASVVRVRGHAVGFAAVSGDGKSTTAASLVAAGHELVCDDVAALVERAGRLEVLPGFPRIRLHDDALASLGEQPRDHPQVHPHIDKRSQGIARFFTQSVPLERLYVLGYGATFEVAPLAPGAALMELLRHTYYAHQYAPLYGLPNHLARASKVAACVPVYRLTRPKDLALLPDLLRLLEAHVAT